MTKHPVSLKDIASALQVSISTVSRALKNHPDISPEVTAKVQSLAREWNYSPNPLAMGLLRQQTKTIGVIVPDLVTYFYSSIISGIEQVAKENGYYIIISSSNESYEKEKECIENLLMSRVEGLIICLARDTVDYNHFDKIINNEMPLVFFDRICRTSEVSSVVTDNREIARELTIHFYDGGARRIAHIAGPQTLSIAKDRYEGYLSGLADCGFSADESLIKFTNLTESEATEATRQLLSLPKPPDAIFSVNDTVSFAAMKEIKRQGLRIPDDISLVAITDEFHATLVDPQLTNVMHPTYEIGQEAARLFLRQGKQGEKMVPMQVVLKSQLVVRASSVKPT
ncbi:MAG: LacI family DNA-binding transcriptional regulator [Bacteroidota bacterium]|nr:LacI family DNA-binding transcriptional regulator [Bacteroidota bacterium]